MDSSGFGNDLVWLSVLIQRRYTQICADHGLTTAQATLLCVIAERPRALGELARTLDMTKNALTGLVDRIERGGLAKREIQPHDRRSAVLKLTQHGAVVIGSLYRDVTERLTTVAEPLTEADKRQFADLVAKVVVASTSIPGGQLPGDEQTGSHPLPGAR